MDILAFLDMNYQDIIKIYFTYSRKSDSVVPLERMEYSKNQLKELSNTLDTKTYKNLDHSINEEGLKLGGEFIKKRL